jgi:hypothetical protein
MAQAQNVNGMAVATANYLQTLQSIKEPSEEQRALIHQLQQQLAAASSPLPPQRSPMLLQSPQQSPQQSPLQSPLPSPLQPLQSPLQQQDLHLHDLGEDNWPVMPDLTNQAPVCKINVYKNKKKNNVVNCVM